MRSKVNLWQLSFERMLTKFLLDQPSRNLTKSILFLENENVRLAAFLLLGHGDLRKHFQTVELFTEQSTVSYVGILKRYQSLWLFISVRH